MAYVRKTEPLEEPSYGRAYGSSESKEDHPPLPLEQDPRHREVRLEGVVAPVLRFGSLLSMALIVLGMAVLAWWSRLDPSSLARLSATGPGSSSVLHTSGQLISGLEAGDPLAIISLGLLVLIATPVLRVASTVVYFLWTGDRIYLAITAFVLLVLIAGFALGSSG